MDTFKKSAAMSEEKRKNLPAGIQQEDATKSGPIT